MADVTVSVKKTGGNFSTVQAAIDDCSVQIESASWYKVDIQDSEEYNENLTTAGEVSTPTISRYLWITAESASNHHVGLPGTGHARIRNTNDAHLIVMGNDFDRIEFLELQGDSTGSSNEIIRIDSGIGDCLISRCILWTDQTTADQDGVYTGNVSGTGLSIDNCLIFGFHRSGLHCQQTSSNARTILWNIDHCTIYDCGVTSEESSGAVRGTSNGGTGDNVVINVYNTAGVGTPNSFTDWSDGAAHTDRDTPDNLIWNGDNNLHTSTLDDMDAGAGSGADNTTEWEDASTNGVTLTTTENGFIVTGVTAGSEDFTLKAKTESGNNHADGTGETRGAGNEPDARQDFSTDIAGNSRATTVDAVCDIGCFNNLSAAGTQDITPSAVTVTATAGTLTVAGDAQAVTPAVVTVTATAGSLVMTIDVVPAAVTVTASAGSLSMTVDVTPAPLTVTATAGTLTITTTVDITPSAVTVTASAGSLSMSIDVVPSAITITATAGSPSLSIDVVPSAVTATVSPGTLTVTTGAVDVTPSAVTVTVTAGSLVVAVAGALDVTPAPLTITAVGGVLSVQNVVPVPVGSWYGLIAIMTENFEFAADEADLTTCPVDGSVMVENMDGDLACAFEGHTATPFRRRRPRRVYQPPDHDHDHHHHLDGWV